MSEPAETITQRECRQRLAQMVFGDFQTRDGATMRKSDVAEWLVASLALAALLAGIPLDRHCEFVDRATSLAFEIKGKSAESPNES